MSREKLRLLADLVYVEKGLVIGTVRGFADTRKDGDRVRKALADLSPADARRAKRKFRKLHRRAKEDQKKKFEVLRSRKGWTHGPPMSRALRDEYVDRQQQQIERAFGKKGEKPTIYEARWRRVKVSHDIQNKIMESLNDW